MSFIEVTDGTRLRVYDRGEGPAVVLIHGWKMSHRAWDRAFYHLAKKFRVISYDLRGMGESDKSARSDDFSQHADDLKCIIDSLALKDVTLVGWSMGCSVVLSTLGKDQDNIARVALMNGPIKLINSESFQYGITRDHLDQIITDLYTEWPERERDFTSKYFWKGHEVYVDWFVDIAIQTPLENVIAVVEEQAKLDFQPVVANADVPILALYGRHDSYYSVDLGHWIASTAKQGSCHIFENSAHCPPIEETEEFVEVLSDFISS